MATMNDVKALVEAHGSTMSLAKYSLGR